jgi:glycosyltransferase involved in cell wall biosynthesis
MQRIAPLLNKDCVKIFYSVFAHWLFHNSAEYQRHAALKQRKGILLTPDRLRQPISGAEYADYITVRGNQFIINTYSYAQKPIYRIPISTQIVYPWPEGKNYESCRNNFIWFGGRGLVHKGLDLLLDVFSEMPDYHLYVCGPIRRSEDIDKVYDIGIYNNPKENAFEKAYYNELYQTPNIHTIGWIDVSSPEFVEIAKKCVGLIHPSCSEGGAGSVINCMHAGLIPIVSFESAVDVNDFGIILQDCSIDTIKENVRMVSCLPTVKLRQMSWDAWEFARANHTKETFAEEYRKMIVRIIDAKGHNEEPLKHVVSDETEQSLNR